MYVALIQQRYTYCGTQNKIIYFTYAYQKLNSWKWYFEIQLRFYQKQYCVSIVLTKLLIPFKEVITVNSQNELCLFQYAF